MSVLGDEDRLRDVPLDSFPGVEKLVPARVAPTGPTARFQNT
jgi:hypothetical protein